MPRIKDEFTDLPVSYSRKQQLRRIRDGLCYRCGKTEPVQGRKLCPPCLVATRERARKREGYRRRIAGAVSYKLQGPEGSELLKEAAAVVAERALARERKRLESHKLEVRAKWAALGKTGPVRGGRPRIEDEFSNLPVSRQRKYQLRRKKAGLCTMCGEPAVASSRCLNHLVEARERLRKTAGCKRRNTLSLSYRLQQKSAAGKNGGKS